MSTTEKGYLYENLRKVISLVDRLRDIGLQKYISLPRIAVVGCQSAGKSSLLEQIVGLDFLPRGTGVVTRRPLELRLVNVPKHKIEKPYGVFEELGSQKFTDFVQVRKNIETLTDKVAGHNKGIVDKPIILTVYSDTCPDLTLIDLPGITRIPIKGSDQKQDIEKVTKDMVKRYIQDPRTIILCVIPANQDISTSDGLLMARQIDPSGERTLGVLTKIDIMDQGTNAKSMLLGQDISLNLGFVGVINRSFKDIQDNKPVLKHLEDEKKYFSTHPVYSTLRSEFCGTSNLTRKVTDIFFQHIRKFLPEIEKDMSQQLYEKEQRLAQLGKYREKKNQFIKHYFNSLKGTPLPETDQERIKFLWQIVSDFSSQFKTSIQGTYHKNSQRSSLPIGCQVREILKDLYSDKTTRQVTAIYQDKDIKRAMLFHEGDSIPGFPSIDAFLSLLIPQLKLLKDPAYDALSEVYGLLEELSVEILDNILEKLPQLKSELQDSIIKTITDEREKARDIISDLIDSEINYIFTNDQQYMLGGNKKRLQTNDPNNKVSGDPGVMELRSRIDAYFEVVMRGVRDSVPKIVGTFLVRASQDKLRLTLFNTVNKSQHFFQFMKEPVHIVEERQSLRKAIKTLKDASKAIKKDPDFSVIFNQSRKAPNPPPQTAKQPTQQQLQQQSNLFGSGPQNGAMKQPQQYQQQQQQQPNRQVNPQQNQDKISSLFGTPVPPQGQQQQQQQQQQNRQQQQVQPPPQQRNQQNNMFGQPQRPMNQAGQQMNQQQQQQQRPPQQNPQQMNKPPGQNMPPQQQQPKQGRVDNAIDSGVDKMFANQKFQDGLKSNANKGMYAAVDSQIPIKDKNGNNPIAAFLGKQAEKTVANDKVQKEMSNQMKSQAKNEVKTKKFW